MFLDKLITSKYFVYGWLLFISIIACIPVIFFCIEIITKIVIKDFMVQGVYAVLFYFLVLLGPSFLSLSIKEMKEKDIEVEEENEKTIYKIAFTIVGFLFASCIVFLLLIIGRIVFYSK